MTRRPTLLATIALAVGLIIALVSAEIIVRAIGISAPLIYLPNPLYGWSHSPNDRYSRRIEDYSVDVQINSLGLRDFEYPYEKVPNRHRTLVLGDSFAEALQVPLSSSFPKIVEKQLNESKRRNETIYEVINSGTSGYGTDNALLFLRHEGYKYEADIVLLALYIGNDIRNNWYALENIDTGGFRKPYFTLSGGALELNAFPFTEHETLISRTKVFLNRNVRLYSLIRETRNRLRSRDTKTGGNPMGKSIGLDTNLFLAEYSKDWDTAWQVTKSLLMALRAEANEHGANLFVVMIPTQFQVHQKYWHDSIRNSVVMQNLQWDLNRPNRILNDFLDKNEIAHIDLLPAFQRNAVNTQHEYYLVQDNHWNEAGHELGAAIIASELIRQLPDN